MGWLCWQNILVSRLNQQWYNYTSSSKVAVFGRVDKTKTEHRQLIESVHIEEVIKAKIKECKRENSRSMVSTSSKLRILYGDEAVNKILQKLSVIR